MCWGCKLIYNGQWRADLWCHRVQEKWGKIQDNKDNYGSFVFAGTEIWGFEVEKEQKKQSSNPKSILNLSYAGMVLWTSVVHTCGILQCSTCTQVHGQSKHTSWSALAGWELWMERFSSIFSLPCRLKIPFKRLATWGSCSTLGTLQRNYWHTDKRDSQTSIWNAC